MIELIKLLNKLSYFEFHIYVKYLKLAKVY